LRAGSALCGNGAKLVRVAASNLSMARDGSVLAIAPAAAWRVNAIKHSEPARSMMLCRALTPDWRGNAIKQCATDGAGTLLCGNAAKLVRVACRTFSSMDIESSVLAIAPVAAWRANAIKHPLRLRMRVLRGEITSESCCRGNAIKLWCDRWPQVCTAALRGHATRWVLAMAPLAAWRVNAIKHSQPAPRWCCLVE
jgi:hypothetical protein